MNKSLNLPDEKVAPNNHHIVAIGASAGGLEAIHEFFDNMPAGANLSFIIIQHLSPDYKSLLVKLISLHTHMEVLEAEHDVEVKENCIYVIPNNKLLTIKNGRLQLEEKKIVKAPNTAVDILFKSLAEDQGSKAIAIILSGTGTDGSKGIVEINSKGGLVIVQDPLTAKFDGMPNSAIATGVADFIMAPELMPEEIFTYINERPQRLAVDGKPDERSLPEVLSLIDKHCHQDFTNYKVSTILRRITRRMGLLGYKEFSEYLVFLRSSAEECKYLGKEFLIGVTKFFRDQAAFDILKDDVLLPLINTKADGDILKVWVTACSTGEEAYSIAILIDELLEQTDKKLEVKIFASDMDGEAIEFASKATYDPLGLNEIRPELVKKYFVREGKKYAVIPRIRKQIVFARHNILKDPPFIKNDLISCRNMLIYMNSILQRKIISTFLFSLNTGSCLFLGPSESPMNILDGFQEINGKWKIYKKVISDNRYDPERIPSSRDLRSRSEKPQALLPREPGMIKELAEDFREALIDKYGFAALYVDKNYEIKEAIGNFKKYLSLPDRISSLNLMRMVGRELSISLNAAIRKATKQGGEVALTNVRTENGDRPLNIFVRPSAKNGHLLIIIGEYTSSGIQKSVSEQPVHSDPGSVNYIHDLEEELKETRGNLQMAVENLETSNEELQSSNEELISANEELQSSNEELQSLNEELHTLNTEHQLRIKELVELNDDLNNYFSSTEIAQVFVDKEFRIRKFNPFATRTINLIESDIGRPIIHISTNLKNNKNFVEDIEKVILTQVPVEKEVEMINGSHNLMRILPYVRQDKNVDGAVITFVDISRVKELDNIIRSVFNATTSAVMAFRAIRNVDNEIVELEFTAANYASDELLKKSNADYIGKKLKDVFPEIIKKGFRDKCEKVINTGEAYHTEIELDRNGQMHWFAMIVAPMMDGVVISLSDIQEKKQAEEKLKKNFQELVVSKENYRKLNLELEKIVGDRTFELSQSEERFRLITTAISDAIWDRDLVNDSIWWSESFYKWFGFEDNAESKTVKFWKEHIHPDDLSHVTGKLNDAINNGKDWEIEYRLQKKDGSYVPVFDRGTVLKNEHGVPYRLLGAITDNSAAEISRQNELLKASNFELEEIIKQRTANLEAQKTILQNLFMQAPALICTLKGPNHVFELVNPVYQRMFGNRKLVGKPIAEALPELRDQDTVALLDNVYNTGESYIGREVKMMLATDEGRDVEEIYFNFIYQPTRNEFDEIDGILAFAYEVTDQVKARQAIQQSNEELKKVNEEFKFVTDFMPQLVWVTAPDGYHLFYNKGWYEYTGLTFEDTKGKGWNDVLHPEDRDRAWKVWSHSLETGEPYEIEYRFKRHDGVYRWFLGRALPLKDPAGNIVKWFGTCTDIHDNKLMNDILEQKVEERTQELKLSNHELEISNNELFQFASIASHDLKEPLRKILMFSSLFYDRYADDLSKGALDCLNKITTSSRRMHALVNDLLSFTRLSSVSAFEKHNLNTILEEVLSDLELTIQEKEAVIEADPLPEADIVPGQIRQVFQNIISNALKFTQPGVKPHIRISARRVSELSFTDAYDNNGPYCRITIQDNGIGFENDYAEKIFTIFQRLHTRVKYEGTGIGLAIARKIIHMHNGIIKATGKKNEGATFTLVLPLQQVGNTVEINQLLK